MGTVASEITNLAALAFETLKKRCFLTADVRAGPKPHFEIEPFSATGDIRTEVALFIADRDRPLQRAKRVRIFGAEVYVAARCTHRNSSDGHPLD